jgi:hypothetical protein
MAKQKQTAPTDEGWPIYDLWTKYEDIAMHFNDLLIKLRTQALGAVAALTTIVGIFAKSGADAKTNWEMVAFALAIIIVFWIAIWIIDFCYYNRLLVGAVKALFDLEVASKDKLHIHSIDLSTKIRDTVAGGRPWEANTWNLVRGRWAFYVIVVLALSGALIFAIRQATLPD